MSLSATLANALTGLQVAQQSLSLTAHNVANANTEGYARKIVNQEAVVVAGTGAGTRNSEITRITDEFLVAEVRRQATAVGRSDVIQRYYDLIQDGFGAPGESRDLATQISELAAALEAFATSPESTALGVEVVHLADGLGAATGRLADQVQRLRGDADQEVARAVADINGELRAIDDLNGEIRRLKHLGQANAELLDKRDALVLSLSQKLDIKTYVQDDGALAIYTTGGTTLLDATPRVLAYDPASVVVADTVFDRIAVFREDQLDPATGQPLNPAGGIELVSSGVRATLTPELQNDAIPDADQLIVSRLQSGRLQGLLEVRDRILPGLDDQIQELADGLRFALNAAHNDGAAWPPPAQLSGTRTDLSDFAGANRSGMATLAVIDTTDGSTLTAFQIDVGAAADEAALVAQINAGLGGLGSATITPAGHLEITLAGANQGLAIAEGDSSITFPDAAGRSRDFGFAHYFGLNDLLVLDRTRAADFSVRQDIASDPARLTTARLDVSGPPLVSTLGGRGDNRAAQALADTLRGEHDFIARGGLSARTLSVGAYAADLIGHNASLARLAETNAGRDQALADALEFRAASVSGVNLDEEMSRLLQFQQAYTVSARIVSIVDELFDELLSTAS